MILISHRGNVSGPNPKNENYPTYIDEAINKGYCVEVDLWGASQDKGKISLSLGHDEPQYETELSWLVERRIKLFIHAKNYEALSALIRHWPDRKSGNLKFFFHESEKYSVIANTSLIWCHDLEAADNYSIIPLISKEDISTWQARPVFGICSDYIETFKKKSA